MKYKEACGPISCYVAMQWLCPNELSLDQIANQLRWNQGEAIPFSSVFSYLENQDGVDVSLTRMAPEQLVDTLTKHRGIALLPVRTTSNKIDHSVCIVADGEGSLMMIDYPNLNQPITLQRLSEIWDGKRL
ncbi:MAG: hypothetical protein R3C03_23695 [Pirellulaceae bacterium]